MLQYSYNLNFLEDAYMMEMLPWKYNLKMIEEIEPSLRYQEGEGGDRVSGRGVD